MNIILNTKTLNCKKFCGIFGVRYLIHCNRKTFSEPTFLISLGEVEYLHVVNTFMSKKFNLCVQ